jgi:hypothetical protein
MRPKTRQSDLTARPRGGWLAFEAFTAIFLLGLLAAMWVVIQRSSATLNEVQVVRQRCILAAQAQLESLSATGRSLDDAEVERCWPGVRTEVRRRPGEGDWQGLTLATVSAAAPAAGRTVQVELSRYLPPEGDGR